jgi:hypothetical protein
MAITTVVIGKTVYGNKKVHYGTYTLSGAATTGDIETELDQVHGGMVGALGALIVADAPTIDETFPLADGDVTIIGTANSSGCWVAVGL